MISALTLALLLPGFQQPSKPQSNAAQPKVSIVDLKLGTGRQAKPGDLLTVEYTGRLTSNGKVFDENIAKPPYAFVLGKSQVIEGWDKGLIGIRVGGKRRLTVPSALGYRAAGYPPDIPANAGLSFDVQCFGILPVDATPKVEIKILEAGSGPAAKLGDTVDVHYVGTYLNGVKFDSSRDRNEPLSFTVGQKGFIKGFSDGVLGMKPGEKRRVTVPPQLAYGNKQHQTIAPNTTLVFELELLGIK